MADEREVEAALDAWFEAAGAPDPTFGTRMAAALDAAERVRSSADEPPAGLRLTDLGRADESILFQRTRNGGLAIEIEEPWADREGGNGVTASVLLTAERVEQLKAWLDKRVEKERGDG